MSFLQDISYEPWPPLSYPDFAATQHLLHMGLQTVGKLKLKEPFEPQWAEVPLWLSSRGLTTGPIPYSGGAYEVTVDLISHQVGCATSWGFLGHCDLASMSVAEFVERLFDILGKAGINASINFKPQEVPNTIPFDQDTLPRPYAPTLVNAWWRILLSTQRVMQIFHGRFKGKTQPIGLMWGTLDIREVRYNGKAASVGEKADYIRRNAMNEELIEVGWWSAVPLIQSPRSIPSPTRSPRTSNTRRSARPARDGSRPWESSSLITTICANQKTLTAICYRFSSPHITLARRGQAGTRISWAAADPNSSGATVVVNSSTIQEKAHAPLCSIERSIVLKVRSGRVVSVKGSGC